MVCDKCNNYFARKVEGPLLNNPSIRTLRARQGIKNKRGRTALGWGLLLEPRIPVDVEYLDGESGPALAISTDDEEKALALQTMRGGSLILPLEISPPRRHMSRLLAKIAVEQMAATFMKIDDWRAELNSNEHVDPLRRYARYGDNFDTWPFHQRRIYGEDARFYDLDVKQGHQVLNEIDLLYTDQCELYCVVAIFGIEFVINVGSPQLDGFQRWLRENDGASPLYAGRNSDAAKPFGMGVKSGS